MDFIDWFIASYHGNIEGLCGGVRVRTAPTAESAVSPTNKHTNTPVAVLSRQYLDDSLGGEGGGVP